MISEPSRSWDGLPLPQRTWAILTLTLGLSLAVIDTSIANVALPNIAAALNVTPSDSIWVINAYQVTMVVSLLALSSLGEIVGYRRIYQVGLVVFTITSLLCALSHSLITLTLGRALQGLGAAGIMSVNPALTRIVYPSRLLGRGAGANALTGALAATLGPVVASCILSISSWPWIFAINVPLGVVGAVAAWRALPANPNRARHAFDWASALLSALVFGGLFLGFDCLGHGAPAFGLLALSAVVIGAGVVLVRRQIGAAAPLLPIDLLSRPLFSLSICTSMFSFAAHMVAYVSIPFLLHDVLGRGVLEVGMLVTPWPLAIAAVAPVAGWLSDRYPAGLLSSVGLVVFAGGLAALAFMPANPIQADVMWRMAVAGAGFGLYQSPNNYLILSSAPSHRGGGASGMLGTARLIGQASGSALAAMLFAALGASASHAALACGIALALVASTISAARLRQRVR